MLHIYTGNGKGKTTASVGLAVRAAGAGLRVYFLQLMKDGTSSEIAMLERLGVSVGAARSCCKFSVSMNAEEKAAASAEHSAILNEVGRLLADGAADLIVLDESIGAYNKRLLDTDKASELTELAASSECELVLTGRGACSPFTDSADYITEMLPHKHPYDRGIPARKGIEF